MKPFIHKHAATYAVATIIIIVLMFIFHLLGDKTTSIPFSQYSAFDTLDTCSITIKHETVPYDCATLILALKLRSKRGATFSLNNSPDDNLRLQYSE